MIYVFSFKTFFRANLEHACEYLHQTWGGGGAEGAGGGGGGGGDVNIYIKLGGEGGRRGGGGGGGGGGGAEGGGGVSKHIIRLIVGLLFRNRLPSLQYASFTTDNIFHLDVHYVCMLVQHFEPQGRHFTNFHYYYY